MNRKTATERLFNIIVLILFCLTFVVSGFAQQVVKPSATAQADPQKVNYDSCVNEYTALIAAQPTNDSFYAERSRCHYFKSSGLMTKSGEHTAGSDAEINLALADAQKAFDLNPKNTAALNVRGIVKSYKNDETGAIADFSRAIEIDPKFFKAYMNRAFRKDKLKDYEGAIADYTKFIEFGTPAASVYASRGNAYFNLGKDTEAIADYDKAIGLGSKDASVYVNRGRSKITFDKNSEAVADFNKAIELNPKYADAFLNRGDYNSKLGKTAEAIADYTKAVELDPKNQFAVDALAKIKGNTAASNTVARRIPPSAAELDKEARSRTPKMRQLSEEVIKSAKILGSAANTQNTAPADTTTGLYSMIIPELVQSIPDPASAQNFRLSLVTPEGSFKSVFGSFGEALGASEGNSYNKILKEQSEIVVMNSRCGDGAYVDKATFSLYKLDGKSSVNGEANKKDISPIVTSYLDYRAANREKIDTPETKQRERALIDEIMKNLSVSRFPRKAECDPIPVALSTSDVVLRLEVDDAKTPLIGSKINDGFLYDYAFNKLTLHERKVLEKYGYNRFANTQDAVEVAVIVPGTKAVIFNGNNFSIYRINPSNFADKPNDSKFDVLKTTPVPKGWKIVVIVYGTKVIRIYDPNAK